MQERLSLKQLSDSLLELISKVPINGFLSYLRGEIEKIDFSNEKIAFKAVLAILEKLKYNPSELPFDQI